MGLNPQPSVPLFLCVCACVQLDSVKTTVDRTATDVESLRTQITSVKEDIQNKTVKSAAKLYTLYLPSLPLPLFLSLALVLSSSVSLPCHTPPRWLHWAPPVTRRRVDVNVNVALFGVI